MQATLQINVNPKLVKADKAIARGVAQELGEDALRAIGSGKLEGTIEAANGTATFKVEFAAEPPAPAK